MKNSIYSCNSLSRIISLLLGACLVLLGTAHEPSSSVPLGHNKSNVFAVSELTDMTTSTVGEWIATDNREWVEWNFTIQRDASSLNFGFSEFVLPSSASLTICGVAKDNCQEYLPKKNIAHHLELWTAILKGGTAHFNLKVLAKEKDQLRFRLSSINKGIVKPIGKSSSQSCLIDIACDESYPQIDEFAAEIQAVGLITIEGTRICSGVLLNNVRADYTPYFLTARHCGINQENAASVVVHWNYQNSTCRLGQDSNKLEGDGSLKQFNSGATFLADLQRSDFTLLRLNDAVIEEANAYFAGWDAKSESPSDVTTIHHANTEEKRITFGAGSTSITRHFGNDKDASLDHIKVENWNISSTAGGSSGAPLFDRDHRVVGQLHGGLAACGNEESDWFGRFHTGWLGDETPDRQLKFWLDPDNTGIKVMDGIWDELDPLALQISASQQSPINCFGDSTGSILVNIFNGSEPYEYSIDGGENYQNEALFQNLAAGVYDVQVRDGNQNSSGVIPFELQQPEELIFSFEQTYNQIKLEVEGGLGPYLFTSADGITFDSIFTDQPQGPVKFDVTDSNGCTKSLELFLSYNLFQVQANIAQSISCFDTQDGRISIVHSGTVGPYQYRLNDGPFMDTNLFTDLASGNYTATVIDSLGNTVSAESINLIAPSIIEAELSQIEENIIVNVSGGTAPYLYQFNDLAFLEINQFTIQDEVEVITIQDANGCEFVLFNTITSTQEEFSKSSLFVYPNPVNNILTMSLADTQLAGYSIMNIKGQILDAKLFDHPKTGEYTINTTSLSAGIYLVNAVLSSGKYKVLKFNVI